MAANESGRDVVAWMKAEGLAHLVEQRIRDVVAPLGPKHAAYRLVLPVGNLTVLEVLQGRLPTFFARDAATMRLTLVGALEDLAALARDALETEAALLAAFETRRDDDELVGIIDRLRATRASLRKTAPPAPGSARGGTLALLDTAEPTFEFSAVDRSRWGAMSIQVQLKITQRGALTPKCSECLEPCIHGVALVDAVLVSLTSKSSESDAVREVLRQEPWQRWMKDLDRRVGALADRDDDARLWWRVDRSTLAIRPLLSRRGKRGNYLKPRTVSCEKVPASLVTPRDAAALSHAIMEEYGVRRHAVGQAVFHVYRALIGHPRVLVHDEGDEPWTVVEAPVVFTTVDIDDHLGLRVRIGDETYEGTHFLVHAEASTVGGSGLVAFEEKSRRVLVTEIDDETYALLLAWAHSSVDVPKVHRSNLLGTLQRMSRHVEVRPDGAHDLPPAARDVVCLLHPRPDDDGLVVDVRVRPILGGPLFVPGEGPRDVVASSDDAELSWARRDPAAEVEHARDVLRTIVADAPEGWQIEEREFEAALALVAKLRESKDVECLWPERDWRPPKRVNAKSLRFEVTASRDWFRIAGGLDVDGGRIDLAILLEAAREHRRYVRMGDGQFVELEAKLVERLAALEPFTDAQKSGIVLLPAAAESVVELGEEAGAYEAAAELDALAERIAAAKDLEPSVPAALQAKLRPYQVEGHAWMARLSNWGAGAVLADDMGLGKTLQAIAVLVDRSQEGPQIVVAPTSVCFNWLRELERFAPSLTPVLYGGTDREKTVGTLSAGTILVVSYGLLARDIAALEGVRFTTLVLDEAQAIKNHDTLRAKAVRALDTAWTVALTGTPVENRALELWSIFSAVFPGLLGGRERFRRRFATPIESGDVGAARALAETIRPYVLRRTKAEVASDLPARTDVVVDIVLSAKEKELYEDARLAAIAECEAPTGISDKDSRFQVLAALTRLRQLACHPRLRDPKSKIPSAKLSKLMRMLRDLADEGRRALVFSQFTKHLDLVRAALEDADIGYVTLTGKTPAAQRAAIVDRFQEGEVGVFLISLKAGGTGLNLTAADTVIHLDPWWNPAAEDQATDRAHRIGQKQPVTVYRLVTRGTIEEEILAMHADKRRLVEDLLSGTDRAGALSSAELIALMKGDLSTERAQKRARPDEAAATGPVDADPEPASAGADANGASSTASDSMVAVLTEIFAVALAAEVDERVLTKSTAAIYERIGRRALTLVDDPFDTDFETWRSAYERGIADGRFPKSDRRFVTAALQRLVVLCEPYDDETGTPAAQEARSDA